MSHPTLIPGLRSPYTTTGGIVYFARMLDKIRLHAEGRLPDAWVAAIGPAYPGTFDSRCCSFLGIKYDELIAETLKGGPDDELLEWAFTHGRRPSADEVEVWNGFMMKRGWRDSGSQRLQERLAEIGLPAGSVETMFDFIEIDEGREPRHSALQPDA